MPIAEKTILAEAIRKALEPVAEKYRLKLSLEDETEDGLAWKLSFSAPEEKEPAEDRIRRYDRTRPNCPLSPGASKPKSGTSCRWKPASEREEKPPLL